MNLREWLFSKRLSMTYFAALIKVDRSYVYRWMRGQCFPSPKIMRKIKEITINEVTSHKGLVDEKTYGTRLEKHAKKK